MKFSIITVCFNSADFIEEAIASVFSQTFQDYEYLIVDGGSKDRTLEIITEWVPKFSGRMRYISEKDAGIYFAMNKGISQSRGEIIGFLNSDDIFSDASVLSSYSDFFSSHNYDAAYADLVYVDRKNISFVQRIWKSADIPFFRMYFGWHPAHPTFYVKKSVYMRFGLFDTKYRIAADYELMLRLIQKNHISCGYLSKTVVLMRSGGVSNANIKNILLSNQECWKSWADNGFFYNPFAIVLKLFLKLTQWVAGAWRRIAILH